MLRSMTMQGASRLFFGLVLPALLGCACVASAADATFLRGVNLNGPTLQIDGRTWEAGNSTGVVVEGKTFENQNVALKPATDPARARMIRSSVWGSKVGVTLSGLENREHRVFLYVWEDTASEQFDLLVNDKPVIERFHSGSAGSWRRLGPWTATPSTGSIKVSARGPGHGAANLSGIELWSGDGEIPTAAGLAFVTQPTPDQVAFFERRIRPVLSEHCYPCHGSDAKSIKGGLLLDSRAGVIKGGDTGPVIAPGSPEASLLIQAVRHTDPNLAMPPKMRLPNDAIADLEEWVRMGAPDPRTVDTLAAARARSSIDWNRAREWWAFQPPRVASDAPSARGIDGFLEARWRKEGLSPAPQADKRILLRRAAFNLTGLPPTERDAEAFLNDSSPEAFAKLVDRLLESPAYGERWGRHWLDVVRYADTAGDNSDFPIPQMHRYRDWVIRAFNRDLPYDQFVTHQLAGDLLQADTAEESLERLVATGYIANSRRFGSRVEDYPQHLTIEDTLDNLGRAFLGLSISCARCHDHKFDPITAADYYALYGFFESTRYPWPGIELEQKQRDLVPLVAAGKRGEAEAARKARDAEKRRLEKGVQALKESLKETPAEKKAEVEGKTREAEQVLKSFVAKGLPFDMAYAVAEARPVNSVIQMKGDPSRPGEAVPRRFLQVLGGQALSEPDASSGRRELAGWIVDRNNPLAARVMVNRIWLHHFGKGLVPTPNDFGKQGKPPAHPELLDWLALKFVESGWSVKAMQRLIMNSRAYQLSSLRSAEAAARDVNNDALSSFPRRRLDAEAIRDSLLVLGGNLESGPGGPHPFPPENEWKFTQHNPFKAVYESRRRTVYLMTQRIQRHPFLAIFDGADPSTSTALRTTSTTPLQALFLLNDPFVHGQAKAFAQRIAAPTPHGTEDTNGIRAAYQLALSRMPDAEELQHGLDFLRQARQALAASGSQSDPGQEAWNAFARALFRLNEFAYLD